MELDIVRAWKDAQYRESLSAEQHAMLPENPVGNFELTDAELNAVNGGSLGALGAGGLLGGAPQHEEHEEEPNSRTFTGIASNNVPGLIATIGTALVPVPGIPNTITLNCLAGD